MSIFLWLTTEQSDRVLPQTAWLLQSGSMAVFAVPTTDEQIEGVRRYLFSVTAGDCLFEIPMHLGKHPYRILAVALEEPRLTSFTLEETKGKLAPVTLAAKWSNQLRSIFSGTEFFLPPIDREASHEIDALKLELVTLHANFFHCLAQLEQRELAEKLRQFQQRKSRDRQVQEQALAELVAVLEPQRAQFSTKGDALLVAAGAVGHALGIDIHPPAQSTNLQQLKDPLEAIARTSHFRVRRVQLEKEWWKTDLGALLGYTKVDRHPVALLPVAPGHYEVFDPQDFTRAPVNRHSAETLSSEAYVFYRPFSNKAIKAFDLVQFAFRGQHKDLLNILWAGVAAALLGMFTPLATGLLVDRAIPDTNRSLLFQIGLGLLVASFGIAVFQFVQRRAILRLQTNIDTNTQAAIWDRLLKLRLSFFREYSSGDLKNRVLAISQIRSRLSGATLSTLFTGLFALLNLGILFFYSAQLALVALVVAVVAFAVTNTVRLFTSRKFRSLQELEGDLFGTMVQMIGGVSKLRVAGAENRAFAYWAKKYTQQLKLVLSTQFLEDVLIVFNKVLPTISLIIFFALAVMFIQSSPISGDGLSTGIFLAFNAAFGAFIEGATNLSNTVIQLLEAGILWERTRPILHAQPEVDGSKADPGELLGNLKLDRVSFRYRENGPLILDRFTLEAKAGDFIALVGPSGSGKSTILRLLLGFEAPEAGIISYDGQDLSGLDLSAVRRQLGVVLQNGRINSASIFENISSGALVTRDEAWEAARLAGLADDIRDMPMEMHTHVAEGGVNLSGGQRQRLLIARALILKPKILFLDEATSALDNRTQAIVSRNLKQLQVTRLAIAHRLSTIRHADRIYVLEAGQIVQHGTFEQLAHQPGLFQRLIARQMM